MSRTTLMALATAALLAAASGAWFLHAGPGTSGAPHARAAESGADGDAQGNDDHGEEGMIHLSEAQIAKAGIRTAEVGPGQVDRELRIVGTVATDADRIAHVVTRVPGIVADIRKRIGDRVARGDVLLVLDSRELAEAKADYLSQRRQNALAQTNLDRETGLWKKRISAERDYLDARTAAETSRIRLDAARQRLATLGLEKAEIEALAGQAEGALSKLEVRAPITGRVISRNAARGELVAAEKEIFSIGDLSSLWIEIPVYGADGSFIREGQRVDVKGPNGQAAAARVLFVEPAVDPQTGSARAVAQLDNGDGKWRPGDFVNGTVAAAGEPADAIVPAEAIQTIGGKSVVFVRTDEGFEKRVVAIGRRNSHVVEIVFGLFPGDVVAASNTFLLKAEASRGEAEHSHAH